MSAVTPDTDWQSPRPNVKAPASSRGRSQDRNPVWLGTVVTRLGPNEIRRRLWHFMPGVLALLATFIPHQEPVAPWILIAGALFCVALAGMSILCFQMYRRPEESNCLMAIFGYAAGVIPLLVLLPSQPELALTVAGVIAFGDGSATLFGLMFGKNKLPWNPRKSWVGLAAFVLVGLPASLLIYWRGAIPPVSAALALGCVVPAVLGSAIMETLPWRWNDNIFVGFSAAAIVIAMHAVLIGWT